VLDNKPIWSKQILGFTLPQGFKAINPVSVFLFFSEICPVAERFVQNWRPYSAKLEMTRDIHIWLFWTIATLLYQALLTLQDKCSCECALASGFQMCLNSLLRSWMLISLCSTDNSAKGSTKTEAQSLCHFSRIGMVCIINDAVIYKSNDRHNVHRTSVILDTKWTLRCSTQWPTSGKVNAMSLPEKIDVRNEKHIALSCFYAF